MVPMKFIPLFYNNRPKHTMKILRRKLYMLLFASTITVHFQAQTQAIQHFDATVMESVTLSEGTNMVTQWNDLSGNNKHALSHSGEIIFPSTSKSITGHSGIGFSGGEKLLTLLTDAESDSILDFTGAASQNTGFAFLLAFKVDSITNDWNDVLGNSSAAAENLHFGLRYKNDGTFQVYLGNAMIQAGTLKNEESIVYAFNYNAGTGNIEFWNSNDGIIRTANVTAADFSNNNAILLGGMRSPTDGRHLNGMVGEVKIFNAALTTHELLEQSEALKLKWAFLANENDPPNPNPATFDIQPNAVSGSIISMTAKAGTDLNEPIEYLFTETSGSPGGSHSTWQRSLNYRDGDLEPLTQYTYTVTMRDALGNLGIASAPLSATTPVYTQPGQENDLEYGAYYGYQGWHFAPGDGRVESNNWVHWFNKNMPDEDNIHGDMWPDLSEYDPNNLYETDLKYSNGDKVKVYSTHDYSTIDLHVKWMKDYGLKGFVVQRFSNAIDKSNNLEQGDKKILDVMTACEKYGVKFYVMHDAGAGDANEVDRVTDDWKHLVDDLGILESPAYAYQDGKPVYGLWGIGVTGKRLWTPEQVHAILDTHQIGNTKYNSYVVGGLSSSWYSNPLQEWYPVYDRLNMIMPWRPLFYNPYSQTNISRMHDEKAWCDTKGIDYQPSITPGGSAGNIGLLEGNANKKRNSFPRNGGYRLWKQAYEVCKMGSKFMYIAMFDEVDEGTAMYKQVETEAGLPVNCRQVSLDEDGYDLPSDWYLQLGNEIQKMLDGRILVSEEMPLTPKELFQLSPTPLDKATDVSREIILKWTNNPNVKAYKVYLSLNLAVLGENNLISTQTDTSINTSVPFKSNGKYFWRVDILTHTQTFKGDMWSFTVEGANATSDLNERNIILYPVPAHDELHVLGVENKVTYSVLSITGEKVLQGQLDYNKSIDMSTLKNGFYILNIDGKKPMRFVKE